MNKGELPKGWVRACLAEIVTLNPRDDLTDFSDDAPVSFVPMQAVEELSGKLDGTRHRPISEVRRGYTQFRDGDLLIAKITPCMENGKFAIADGLKNGRGFGSTEFHVLRCPPGISNRYVFYYAIRQAFRNGAAHNMKGTAGQKRVPVSWLEQVVLPVPPAAEQERIVAAIDALFTRLDAAERELNKAQLLLKQFRLSALHFTVVGKMRAFGKPTSGVAEADPRLPDLPSKWIWKTFHEVASISGGLTKSKKREHGLPLRPYLRVANVYADDLRLHDVQEIGVADGDLPRVVLKRGDLLIVEGNGSVDQIGRVAIWDDSIHGCVHQNHLIKVRFPSEDMAVFALFWLLSPLGRRAIEKTASSTSGLHTLSISKVSSLPIPVPPPSELRALVARLRDTVYEIRTKEAQLTSQLSLSSSTRQSILAAAYSGELVPQDANDEPVEKLLERIRSRHAAEAAPPKRSPRKPGKAAA